MEIRPIASHDELRKVGTVVRAALLSGPHDDDAFEKLKESIASNDSLVMWDGDECVGHVAGFRFDTTVPGGARLPTNGVTGVGVRPTHTRRGVLTTLMDRLLREARERGQVIASLRASEAPIYGRFGFGLGGDKVAAVITRDRARPFRHAPAPGSMRMLLGDEPIKVIPDLYDRVARTRVGTINRYDWHWRRILDAVNKQTSSMEDGGTFAAVHTDLHGVDDGYVQYSVSWADRFAENWRGEGRIHALWGADDAVERALWQYLLDIDLIVKWRAEDRPSEDPIRRSLFDPRAYLSAQRMDEQWVRVLRVDEALTTRTYGPAAASVVLGVDDPLFEDNRGRWRIGPDGARRTTDEPDLTLDITPLGSAYLGGVSWRDMAASGEIDSADDATLATLDALFSVRPIPFCGTDF